MIGQFQLVKIKQNNVVQIEIISKLKALKTIKKVLSVKHQKDTVGLIKCNHYCIHTTQRESSISLHQNRTSFSSINHLMGTKWWWCELFYDTFSSSPRSLWQWILNVRLPSDEMLRVCVHVTYFAHSDILCEVIRSVRETMWHRPDAKPHYCHVTEWTALVTPVSSVQFTVPPSPPSDSVGDVAHLVQFEK